MRLNCKKGFTLIEVIVVAAIIAILAGILVPMIFNQIDESRITRAKADVKAIQTAMLRFQNDTGKWPVYSTNAALVAGTPDIVLLKSGGNNPSLGTATGWDTTNTSNHIQAQLVDYANATGIYNTVWKGPYIPGEPPADPWGNKYYINVDAFNTPGAPVWIISAGPDGIIDTNANAESIDVNSKNIGIRVR